MKKLSSRIAALPTSAATAVDYMVKARRAAGCDVVSFCVGEPDFPTPPIPAEAGIRAIREGKTGYTAPAGTPELRQAICEAMERECGLRYTPSMVAVTTGAKYAVYAAVMAMAEDGDEFIIPTPCWPSYAPIVTLCHGKVVYAEGSPERDYKLTPETLRSVITERSKALILNDPCNPSGAVYDREELAALMEVCREADLYVVADEVYSGILYDGRSFVPAASVSRDAFERTVTVSGVSKSYAMTGWRLGWACASEELIAAMTVFLNHTTGNPSTIAQEAALAALRSGEEDTEHMSRIYEQRRNVLLSALRELGLDCPTPAGAFYIMADVRSTALPDGNDFAMALLEEENVAVVPCADYGFPGFVRFAYTLDTEEMEEGIARLRRFLGKERP